MIKKLYNKYYKNSEFGKNIITLATGTSIAQAIPLAISPILTRLYTPTDFGIFALYLAFVTILGEISNGRYELAIVLPKKEEDAINIFALGFILNLSISFFILILVTVFNKPIALLLGDEQIAFWLYFSPISIFFFGFFNNLTYFNNRYKKYKDIRNATIIKSIVLASIQLIIALLKSGVTGLMSGQIFSQLFANLRLLKNTVKDKTLLSKITKSNIIRVAKRYENFPKFSLGSSLMNSFSLRVPIFLMVSFFNTSIVGFYSLAHRSISLPMGVIGDSVAKVFFQKSAQLTNDRKQLRNLTLETYKKLFLIGVLPFSFIAIFGDVLFAFVFGLNWRIAGEYSQYLSLWTFLVFVISPLSTLFDTFEKQKHSLYFNAILLVLRIISVLVGALYFENDKITVILYASVGIIFWLFLSFYLLNLGGVGVKDILLFSVKYLLFAFTLLYLLRFFIIDFLENLLCIIYN